MFSPLRRWRNIPIIAKNLTNAPLRFYERAENRPLQREFYLYTLEWGLRVKL
jgi:hypothetical protein